MTNITKLLLSLVLIFSPMMVANAAANLEQSSALAIYQSEAEPEPGTEESVKKPEGEEEEPEC